jgi:hypothetical protein
MAFCLYSDNFYQSYIYKAMSKKALLVGINYTGTSAALNGCINDVTNIKSILENKFRFTQVNVMTDNTIVKPTRANIQAAIAQLITGLKAGDTIVFHYSGHGSSVNDANRDETDGKDEVLVPLDYQTAGFISDDWLNQNLCTKIPKDVLLLCFSDCCHSGTMLDLKYNVKSQCAPRNPPVTQYTSSQWTDSFAFSNERGIELIGNVICLSGCEDPDTSADARINGTSQGAFTACLLEYLKGPSGNSIKPSEMLKCVNALLDLKKFKQNSQLSTSNLGLIDKVLIF